jgi:hypothetical protein
MPVVIVGTTPEDQSLAVPKVPDTADFQLEKVVMEKVPSCALEASWRLKPAIFISVSVIPVIHEEQMSVFFVVI